MTSVHDEIGRLLDAAGLRYTPGRRALIEVLARRGPSTLPEILAAAPELTQSSAYRHLSELEGAGVVQRVPTPGDHTRVELADGLTRHHHHLVCDACGAVIDIELDAELEAAVETALARVAARHAFVGRRHDIDLHGRCRSCGPGPSGAASPTATRSRS